MDSRHGIGVGVFRVPENVGPVLLAAIWDALAASNFTVRVRFVLN